jgi:hypothetical protein
MKEIAITFSPEELIELAKQLYMASYMTISFPYDNQKMADEIYNRVCATGYLEVPELGAFREGGFTETAFTISSEVDDLCEPIVEQFQAHAVADDLPYSLADRDFQEKYGQLEPLVVVKNPELLSDLKAIQEKYKKEFERYGVIHLRLEEEK